MPVLKREVYHEKPIESIGSTVNKVFDDETGEFYDCREEDEDDPEDDPRETKEDLIGRLVETLMTLVRETYPEYGLLNHLGVQSELYDFLWDRIQRPS